VPEARLAVVHNGVDRERFAPRDRDEARRRLGLPVEGDLLLFVGHLAEHKGARDLIAAAERLAALRPSARVMMVGDGPLAGEARAASARSGGRLIVAGHVPHAAVAEHLAAADLLCLPSWDEGLPNVVREAHASGRRVVATAVGGIPEAVHAPELGRLVPPRDPDALAAALAETLGEPPVPPARILELGLVSTWSESAQALLGVLEAAAR
jgi:teichuronic acid biosynthesis glycosyltransferase TuaC